MTSTHVLSESSLEIFRQLVIEKSGIDLPASRRTHLAHAISTALERNGRDDPAELYALLSSPDGNEELEEFIASLTVGETHFFRNQPQFQALEEHILPELIRRRSAEKRLRIWCAGCSSGEEPYSLAILLDRLLGGRDNWNVSILGTDIDRSALKRAQAGSYRGWSFREVPQDVEGRYFTRVDGAFQVIPRIRSMVTFEYLNLIDDVYPSLLTRTNSMDLILCRNVLIYFGPTAIKTVLYRFKEALADEGWLLLGHAEPSHWMPDGFALENFPGAIAHRRSTHPSGPAKGATSEPHDAFEYGHIPHPTPKRGRRSSSAGHPQRQRKGSKDPKDSDARAAPEMRYQLSASDPYPPYLNAKFHAGRLEIEDARKWITTALEQSPLFAPAHYLEGLLALEDNRPDDAVAALRRCVYADPTWALGHYALGQALIQIGDRRRAAASLRNAERLLLDHPAGEEIMEGDGLTAGRLRELIGVQKEIFQIEVSERA